MVCLYLGCEEFRGESGNQSGIRSLTCRLQAWMKVCDHGLAFIFDLSSSFDFIILVPHYESVHQPRCLAHCRSKLYRVLECIG